jgi:uncharacterized membrane protein YcaP (DUF421 family)
MALVLVFEVRQNGMPQMNQVGLVIAERNGGISIAAEE